MLSETRLESEFFIDNLLASCAAPGEMWGEGCGLERGGCRLQGGGFMVEGGGWKVEGGRWRVEACPRERVLN